MDCCPAATARRLPAETFRQLCPLIERLAGQGPGTKRLIEFSKVEATLLRAAIDLAALYPGDASKLPLGELLARELWAELTPVERHLRTLGNAALYAGPGEPGAPPQYVPAEAPDA